MPARDLQIGVASMHWLTEHLDERIKECLPEICRLTSPTCTGWRNVWGLRVNGFPPASDRAAWRRQPAPAGETSGIEALQNASLVEILQVDGADQ